MAKNKKKRKPSHTEQPVIHRYTAETEERKQSRKKLKIKSILTAVIAGLLLLLSQVIF